MRKIMTSRIGWCNFLDSWQGPPLFLHHQCIYQYSQKGKTTSYIIYENNYRPSEKVLGTPRCHQNTLQELLPSSIFL